jgi:hypothetical protein
MPTKRADRSKSPRRPSSSLSGLSLSSTPRAARTDEDLTPRKRLGSPRVSFAPHSPVMTRYIPPYSPGMATHSPVMEPHSPRFSYGIAGHSAAPGSPAIVYAGVPDRLPLRRGSPQIQATLIPRLTFQGNMSGTAQFAAAATSLALANHGFEPPEVLAGVYEQDYSRVPDASRVPMWAGLPQPVFASSSLPVSEMFAPLMAPPWVRPRSPILADWKNEYGPGYRAYLPPGAIATAPGIYDARCDPTPSIHDLGHRPSRFVIFY